MKKSHKAKSKGPKAKPRGYQRPQAAPVVAHTTRRQTPLAERAHLVAPRAKTAREPAALYRRYNPLRIESSDDRRAFRLLLAPFAAMALLLAVMPALQAAPSFRDLINALPLERLSEVKVIEVPDGATRDLSTIPVAASRVALAPLVPLPETPPLATPVGDGEAVPVKVPVRTLAMRAEPAATPQPAIADEEPVALPNAATAVPKLLPPGMSREVAPTVSESSQQDVALLRLPDLPDVLPLPPSSGAEFCPVSYAGSAAAPVDQVSNAGQPFGVRLARAAGAQTEHFVIYDDKYRRIPAVMGDVPALFGVCTDVVVRAYRAVGVDLQGLVHTSRIGSGDPSIDHRRTETLRRFFGRFGQTLPVTDFAEDYAPGDVVTYWRPQNSGSRSHIAIVADKLGPSGRPMIIHNRGWGPQMEDALFVDRITGHYRYEGRGLAAATPVLPSALTGAQGIAMRPSATPVSANAPGLHTTQPARF